MRTTIWVSMVAAALLSGAGCKKKEEPGKAMDRAATTAAKAQEDINEQAKDVRNEQKDVAKEQADVNKQQGELNAAETDLAQARERYNLAAKQRMATLEDKIHRIEMKGDAAAKDAAAKLRARRDELAGRLNAAGSTAKGDWDNFKKDVDDSFDKLEKDVDAALK